MLPQMRCLRAGRAGASVQPQAPTALRPHVNLQAMPREAGPLARWCAASAHARRARRRGAPEVLDGALGAAPQLQPARHKARHDDDGVLRPQAARAQRQARPRRVLLAEDGRQAHAVRQLDLRDVAQALGHRLHQRPQLLAQHLALRAPARASVRRGARGRPPGRAGTNRTAARGFRTTGPDSTCAAGAGRPVQRGSSSVPAAGGRSAIAAWPDRQAARSGFASDKVPRVCAPAAWCRPTIWTAPARPAPTTPSRASWAFARPASARAPRGPRAPAAPSALPRWPAEQSAGSSLGGRSAHLTVPPSMHRRIRHAGQNRGMQDMRQWRIIAQSAAHLWKGARRSVLHCAADRSEGRLDHSVMPNGPSGQSRWKLCNRAAVELQQVVPTLSVRALTRNTLCFWQKGAGVRRCLAGESHVQGQTRVSGPLRLTVCQLPACCTALLWPAWLAIIGTSLRGAPATAITRHAARDMTTAHLATRRPEPTRQPEPTCLANASCTAGPCVAVLPSSAGRHRQPPCISAPLSDSPSHILSSAAATCKYVAPFCCRCTLLKCTPAPSTCKQLRLGKTCARCQGRC